MHGALILIAVAISLVHDHWRATIGRRRPLSGKIAVLEERVERPNHIWMIDFTRLKGRSDPSSSAP